MKNTFKYIAISILGLILLYVTPLFFDIQNWKLGNVFPEVLSNDDYKFSLIRTISFASLSTFVVILLSFVLGYNLRKLRDKKMLLLGSFLLLPFLLGSVSTGFLFKILLFNSSLLREAYNNTFLLFGILAIIQFWQFGTLFAYIFWLNNLSIDKDLIDYTNYYRLTTWEKIKNVYLPYHRNLIILLSIFFFVSNIYESAKLQVIFRASKGTNSELISNTLYNAYLIDSKISPDFAANVLFSQTALFYLPIFLIAAVVLYFILNQSISFFSKTKFSIPVFDKVNNEFKNFSAKIILVLLTLFVMLPIFFAFFQQGLKFGNLDYLLSTIGLSFIASILVIILFTLPLSYYLRIVWMEVFHKISSKNLWIFITVFLLFLIPPLSLMLFGFEWNSIIGVKGKLSTNVSWILGQCISSLPIIASFIFVVHFTTKNKELEYLNIMKVNFSEVVKWSFLKRFKIEYIMTFLFAFSIIWNEGTFNKIYSDRIPSYVSEILRTVNSRNADYSQGMMYLLFSMLLGISCIILWNIVVARLVNINQHS